VRKPNLIIFTRAPLLGTVKRRLAADIGDSAARRFHANTTCELVGRLAADRRWRTWLAVTPDRFARIGRFWPTGVQRLPQGQGDLGVRMATALARFPGGPAVLVGSDIPALHSGHILAAFAALRGCDAVFGPAADGGYWLVGVRNGGAALPGMFRNVRWSTRHALDDTLANFSNRRTILLETLDDVDDGRDYARWRKVSAR